MPPIIGRAAEWADALGSPFIFMHTEINKFINAEVVELADTQRSGRCALKGVGVQISPSAQKAGVSEAGDGNLMRIKIFPARELSSRN